MKLFLCSSFITLDTQKDFESLINKPLKGLKIACVTTASKGYVISAQSKGEKANLSWLENDFKSARETFGCLVDTFDIETIPQTQMLDIFSEYDAVWMEGGMTIYLMNAVISSKFNEVLAELLKRKIYIGSSAGSMICSKSLDATEWYIGDPEENPNQLGGLGYIDFQIYPHFDQNHLENIKKARHLDQEYWLLKDGQAVSVNDNKVTACGGEIIKLEKQI